MKTRIVHTKIYKDEFFSELTPTEKLLFLYFLTNERVNIIHCYEITEREITFDTGIDRSTIGVAKEKFQAAGKMFFFENWVYLRNAAKYETYTGNRNETAKEKLLLEMSQPIKDWYFKLSNTPIDTPIDTSLIGTINHKSEIINKKEEGECEGEKKKNYSSLSSLTDDVIRDLAASRSVNFPVVDKLRTELSLYCQSKGKTYKNYKAALDSWLIKRIDDDPTLVRKKYRDPLLEASLKGGYQ